MCYRPLGQPAYNNFVGPPWPASADWRGNPTLELQGTKGKVVRRWTSSEAAHSRPARDRSLVTVSALIASGQGAQVPYHLNRAMDNDLTQAQAAEAITHLAFYVGWPNAMSALPVAKELFEKRAR
ncbi:MAG: carboxymuconolactone decarboxylase family protein [Planctomycetes bacterium]|nr:carboxymuconolactone decarboxylase family protein [Planctomycetota bacterium]